MEMMVLQGVKMAAGSWLRDEKIQSFDGWLNSTSYGRVIGMIQNHEEKIFVSKD